MDYVTGNLIDLAEQGYFDIIVQGCNCFKTMGGGIAREIRSRYPKAAEVDASYSFSGDYTKLGNYTVMPGKSFNIINAYTQYNMSTGSDVFEYTAFDLILQKLAYQYSTCRFGFPMIGCGLAGGDEYRIMDSIRGFAETIAPSGGTVTIVKMP